MQHDDSVEGKWTGRLIDVQGFEGELTFELREEKKGQELYGSFDVTLAGTHAPIRQEGSIRGTRERGRLVLVVLMLQGEKRQPVSIRLEGDAKALKEGGIGLCATYDVSVKGFSPLQGGVVVARTALPLTRVRIQTESVKLSSST